MGENLNVLNTVQCTQCTALHPLNSQTAGGACLARTEANMPLAQIYTVIGPYAIGSKFIPSLKKLEE